MEKQYYGITATQIHDGVPLNEYLQQLVKAEVATQLNPIHERLALIEKDLILSKQQMTETVTTISETFGNELGKLMEDRQQDMIEATVQVLHERLNNISTTPSLESGGITIKPVEVSEIALENLSNKKKLYRCLEV